MFFSKNRLTSFILICFIIANTYLGQYKVLFGISIRVPFAIIMLFFIVLSKNNKRDFLYKNEYVYILIFLIGSVLSIIVNKADIMKYIISVLLSNFLISFILIWSLFNIIRISISTKRIIVWLCFALTINSMFLIGKYLNIQVFWTIAELLNYESIVDSDVYSYYLRRGKVSGLVNTVYSGYLIIVAIPFSLYYFLTKNRIIGFLLITINFIACVLLQQRTAFILVLFVLLFFFFKNREKFSTVAFFSFTLMVLGFLFNYLLLDIVNSYNIESRILNYSDESRSQLYSMGLNFCLDNPIWGGLAKFIEYSGGLKPHFIFLNAWIIGGLVGFIAIILLLVSLLKKVFRVLLVKKYIDNFLELWILGLAILSLILISFTHNAGLTSGDSLTYLILTLFLIEYNFSIKKVKA